MATRSQAQRLPAGTAPGIAVQPVRRNLFNSHLSRRPTRSDSTTSSATTVIDTPLDETANSDESSEILIRNANGDYATNIPDIAVLMATTNGAMEGIEPSDEFEDDGHLTELLRTRTRHSNEQELLEAVRINLKRKIEALADDDWMFQSGK